MIPAEIVILYYLTTAMLLGQTNPRYFKYEYRLIQRSMGIIHERATMSFSFNLPYQWIFNLKEKHLYCPSSKHLFLEPWPYFDMASSYKDANRKLQPLFAFENRQQNISD